MAVTYSAPLENIEFTFNHVVQETIIESSLLTQILNEAGRFASSRLAPLNLPGDQSGAALQNGDVITPLGYREAYQEWADAGWTGVAMPEEYGGAGLPEAITAALDEIWNAANMAFYVCPTLTQAAARLILVYGTSQQKLDYLPNLISGRWTASMGLTEPQAGSDLSLIKTTAAQAEEGTYRLRGAKLFTSYGEHDWTENIIQLVLARITSAPAGSRGLSLFIVPKFLQNGQRNDVYCTGIEHKLGLRASPTCSMSYGDEAGAIGYLLGPVNSGLSTMFIMMNKARIACGLQAVGIAELALQQASAFAAERIQGKVDGAVSVIARHPDVARMLLHMEALVMAARSMVYTAVSAVENHSGTSFGRGDLLTPVAKVFCSEIACEVATLNIQVHGGMGYIEDTGASQLLRDARAIPIYEGTNGIQAIDLLTRKLLPDGGSLVEQELVRLSEAAADLAEVPEFQKFSDRLDRSIRCVRKAVKSLLNSSATDRQRLASAMPFITLFGDTCAGGYIARGLAHASKTPDGVPVRITQAAHHYSSSRLTKAEGILEEIEDMLDMPCEVASASMTGRTNKQHP